MPESAELTTGGEGQAAANAHLERRLLAQSRGDLRPAAIDLSRRIAVIGDPTLVLDFIAEARGGCKAAFHVLPITEHPKDYGVGAAIEAVKSGEVDLVYFALPYEYRDEKAEDALVDAAVSHYLVRRPGDAIPGDDRSWTAMGSLEVICIWDVPVRAGLAVKRAIDLLGALLLLLLLSPLLVVISVLIKAASPGPIFFKQRRVGLNGQEFLLWKFRTMTVTDDAAVVAQATSRDRRVTVVGAILRRTSFDELPQLINIMQGSMSIVGPRPYTVPHTEMYARQIKRFAYRQLAKPGVTGLAQINGLRGETANVGHMEMRVAYDLEYQRRWSLLLDLKIILRTGALLLQDSRAY